MRISFAGMDTPVDVCEKGATVLCVMNEGLFARMCESLLSLEGEEAVEPYSVWSADGCEVNPANALLVIANPFDLPWKHRSMVNGLYAVLGKSLSFDEGLRCEMQSAWTAFESSLHKLGFQLNGDYRFGVEWNLESCLKAFSYEADVPGAASLLENLISFVDFGADIGIDKVLVFVNLKTFLTKNEMAALNDRLVFHGIAALFLEGSSSRLDREVEKEYVVDRDFVEYMYIGRSECSFPSQGEFCSNGFGAVTF